MPNRILSFLLIALLLASCDSADNSSVSTYTVTRGTFENSLVIEGFTEPVRSVTVLDEFPSDANVKFLVEDGTHVEEGDLICTLESEYMESQYELIMQYYESGEMALVILKAQLELEYTMLEAQARNNEADTEIARMDSLRLEYASPTQRRKTELELERVAINKERYDKKLVSLRQIHELQIQSAEMELQNFRNQIKRFEGYMEKLEYRAPSAGMAIRPINGNSPSGAKLQEGDPVWFRVPLVMLPDLTAMKVKIMASERDYKQINVNDSVTFTFDAMPGKLAYGRITKKPPVGKPIQRGSKVKHFEIEASLDSVEVLPEPGFTAKCNISLREIEDTLFIPQISIFDQDSTKVAYVKLPRGFEMREVATGVSSAKMIVVSAGLEEGEQVALRKPMDSQIKKRTMLPKEKADDKDDAQADPETDESGPQTSGSDRQAAGDNARRQPGTEGRSGNGQDGAQAAKQ